MAAKAKASVERSFIRKRNWVGQRLGERTNNKEGKRKETEKEKKKGERTQPGPVKVGAALWWCDGNMVAVDGCDGYTRRGEMNMGV